MAITPFASNSSDQGRDVLIQSDGKIVIAGYSTDNSGVVRYSLVRLTTTGSMDPTFSSDGYNIVDVSDDNLHDAATCIAIQADGNLVVGGYSFNGSNYDMAITRINGTTGVQDNSLHSPDGDYTFDFDGETDRGYDILVLPNQSIVVIGRAGSEFGLGAVLPNGYADTNFGPDSNGKVTTQFANASYAYAGIRHPWSKILVVGRTIVNSTLQFAIARYNSDGTLDNTFDSDGMVTTAFGMQAEAHAAGIQSTGRIIVAGTTTVSGDTDIAIAGYQNDVAVGIQSRNAHKTISVYPNPFSGSFTVSGTKAGQTIELLDALGKEVLTQNAADSETAISVEEIHKGFYYVRIISDSEVQTIKVVNVP